MFGTIRKHQTWLWAVIITLTVISFVIYFSPYSRVSERRRGPGQFGSINGEVITEEQFVNAQRDVYLRYFFMSGGHWPDTADAKKKGFDIEQQTYQWLLLLQEQERFGIHISTDAAAQLARQLMAQFGRGGNVPPGVFLQQVLQPKGFDLEDLDRFSRHSLGLQELAATVGLSGKLITEQEAKELYRRAFEEVAAEAVFFTASNYLGSVSVMPEAVAQFYTNQLANYRIPERVQVSYVRFPLTNYLAEANRELAALTNLDMQIDQAYREQGTNFLREVKAASLEDAKIKIRDDRRKAFEAQSARKAATEFAAPIFGTETNRAGDLEKLAKQMGLAFGISAPFDREEGPKEFEVAADFVQKAFSRTPDDPFAGPFVGQDAVYVIAFQRRIPSEIPALDQIRDRVTADYKYGQALVKARIAGADFYRTLTNSLAQGKSFAAACVEAKLKPMTLPPFAMSTRYLPDVEVNTEQLKQLAFGTPVGKASSFQPTSEGGMILFVRSKLPLDEAKMQAALPAFLRQERQKRQDEAFNLWFSREASTGLRDTPLARPQQPPPAMRSGPPAQGKS